MIQARPPCVLSIAGSDPSGGAGIQADLKTFAALGVYGMAAITSLTAQNTCGVRNIHTPPATFLRDQIEAVFEDIPPDAVKIGMVHGAEEMHVIADILRRYAPNHIVIDPVMVATSGAVLQSEDALEALKGELLPLATLITPNLAEATILFEGSHKIYETFGVPILIKGGHASGANSIDVFYQHDRQTEFIAPRIETQNTHGTGCTLSAAIAAYLAKGEDLHQAIQLAKNFLTDLLNDSQNLTIGSGNGPLFYR